MFSGCIAVGTASGVIFVLMPRSINPADGKATGWVVVGTNRLSVLLLEMPLKGMHIVFVFLVGSHYCFMHFSCVSVPIQDLLHRSAVFYFYIVFRVDFQGCLSHKLVVR